MSVDSGRDLRPVTVLIDGRDVGPEALRSSARLLSGRLGTPYCSRSYSHGYAAVTGHCQPVGIDIELVTPWPAGAESILTPAEQPAALGSGDDEWVTSVWCGKEALAKALGRPLRYDPQRLAGPHGWPGGVARGWAANRLPLPAGLVGWVCWRRATDGLGQSPGRE